VGWLLPAAAVLETPNDLGKRRDGEVDVRESKTTFSKTIKKSDDFTSSLFFIQYRFN
jgi:hypothetical protein